MHKNVDLRKATEVLYNKTSNKYTFRFLQTGITGIGIPCVYLPQKPPDRLIQDTDAMWQRESLPSAYDQWYRTEDTKKLSDHEYVHPELEKYRQSQYHKRVNGFWFWNTEGGKRVATYITGEHWLYLQWWKTRFGYPKFRLSDMEFFYWWEYVCEDPKCYGGIFGTRRRAGKSAKMGILAHSASSLYENADTGMQGEDDDKIKIFYEEHVREPFLNLPRHFMPVYDRSTKLTSEIKLMPTIQSGKKGMDAQKEEGFGGRIDYQPTLLNKYNSRKLKRYIGEEFGKIVRVNVKTLFEKIKECLVAEDDEGLRQFIYGKFLSGTTTDEDAEMTRPFKELCIESDFDVRTGSGETESGLYFSFMPAQHCMIYDKYGVPQSDEANIEISHKLEAKKNDPEGYSLVCRKYPRTIQEYFYVNAKDCQFDIMVLQNRKTELSMKRNIVQRYDLAWKDDKRFTELIFRRNDSGKFYCFHIPEPEDLNRVRDTGRDGYERFEPQCDDYLIGHDPVMFGKTKGKRKSKPAALAWRRFDPSVDGELTEGSLVYKRENRIPYKTNIPHILYDKREDDPAVYYESMLKLCWALGCQINVEFPMGKALEEYFKMNGCHKFIFEKDKKGYLVAEKEGPSVDDETEKGTHAHAGTTEYYSRLLATWVFWFGHSNPFEQFNDCLLTFDPTNTTDNDYSVAGGMALLGINQVKKEKPKPIPIEQIFRTFDVRGNTARRIR